MTREAYHQLKSSGGNHERMTLINTISSEIISCLCNLQDSMSFLSISKISSSELKSQTLMLAQQGITDVTDSMLYLTFSAQLFYGDCPSMRMGGNLTLG